MNDIIPNKKYYIRAFVADQVNADSETGLLDWDWEPYIVQSISSARSFSSLNEATEAIEKIVTEKPVKNAYSKTLSPPNKIYRIGRMNYERQNIMFRLSVLEMDIDNIKMKELNFVVGAVSFEKPNIRLSAIGPENWLKK